MHVGDHMDADRKYAFRISAAKPSAADRHMVTIDSL